MQLTAWTLRQEHNNSSNMIGIIKGKQHTTLGAADAWGHPRQPRS
jgi:hypothetical protein